MTNNIPAGHSCRDPRYCPICTDALTAQPPVDAVPGEPVAWHVEWVMPTDKANRANWVKLCANEKDALDYKARYPDTVITPLYATPTALQAVGEPVANAMPRINGADADEEDAFNVWFEQYRQQSWLSAGCDKDRGPVASAAWGLGQRPSLLRGWLARASFAAPVAPRAGEEPKS